MNKGAELWMAGAAAAGIIAQQVAAKVVRDALFLSSFPATLLPYAVGAGAGLSLLFVLLMSRLFAHRGPAGLLPPVLVVNGACFVAEWFLATRHPGPAAVLVHLHTTAIGGVVISGFWSVINERFDPHTIRSHIARITTGATLGGLLGGLAADRIAHWQEPRTILLVVAGLNLGTGLLVKKLSAGIGPTTAEVPPKMFDGLKPLVARPYLRAIALVVVAVTLLEVFLEYALNLEAARTHNDPRALVSFFAVFYTGTALVTLVIQLGLTHLSLERLGLSGTLLLRPAVVIVSAVAALAHLTLPMVALACGLQAALGNSLFRSAYELLYTPIAPGEKRPTKVVIDVGLARVASMIGSGAILILVAMTWSSPLVFLGLAIASALLLTLLSLGLHARYVQELAISLQSGAIQLETQDIVDLTTRRTLASTTVAIDRDRLLAEIEALRAQGSGGVAAAVDTVVRREVDAHHFETDRRLKLIRTFTTGTSAEILAGLEEGPIEPHWVPFLIPLLGGPEPQIVAAVTTTLKKAVAAHAGLLTDFFLDPRTPRITRRRLTQILEGSDDPRVSYALFQSLPEADFELRFLIARALLEIRRKNPSSHPPTERVFTQIRAELSTTPAAWKVRSHFMGEPEGPTPGHRGLELVFNLLGLVLDPEVSGLCLGALNGRDERLRGTAVEYLLNVLPADVAAAIIEKVMVRVEHSAPPRPALELAQDLRASAAAIRLPTGEPGPG
ncbi:MAG: hypothetical protein IPG45_31490 [Deltaproteobacteria bacterium]|nr:hypothetical protein [Deltaproteobacteria bacterium]